MGLETVVTDKDPAAPGLKLADHAEVVDTLDLEGMLRVGRKHRVDGVIAEQTDIAVPPAAYVAEQMGLPGIGYETALAATNKWLMRERCRVAGVPGPRYRKAATLDEARAAAEEIGLPVVIKPVDAQASRGVAKISDVQDISPWFEKTRAHSREGLVLIEEMMTGTESSAEAFVVGDHIEVLGICDKTKCSPPYSFDTRLIYPAAFPSAVLEEIKLLNERVVRAVGVRMGITHAEYVVTDAGVRLIEVAARGCGAGVATRLIPAMTGVDLVGARIRQALGVDDALGERTLQKSGILEFLLLPHGRVKKIAGLSEARQIAGVIDIGLNVRQGDAIGIVESGDQRHGHLLAVAETRVRLLEIIEEVRQTLEIEMESPPMTSS
jgi:biotin carboxylase